MQQSRFMSTCTRKQDQRDVCGLGGVKGTGQHKEYRSRLSFQEFSRGEQRDTVGSHFNVSAARGRALDFPGAKEHQGAGGVGRGACFLARRHPETSCLRRTQKFGVPGPRGRVRTTMHGTRDVLDAAEGGQGGYVVRWLRVQLIQARCFQAPAAQNCWWTFCAVAKKATTCWSLSQEAVHAEEQGSCLRKGGNKLREIEFLGMRMDERLLLTRFTPSTFGLRSMSAACRRAHVEFDETHVENS